jgi:hypothetical protein
MCLIGKMLELGFVISIYQTKDKVYEVKLNYLYSTDIISSESDELCKAIAKASLNALKYKYNLHEN